MRWEKILPRRVGALVAIAGVAATCGCASGAPPRGLLPPCSSALDYRVDPPLHAPLADTDWPAEHGDRWTAEAVPSELGARLSARLFAILEQTGAAGATAAVGVPGLGLWSATVGLARRAPAVPVNDDSLFWWASVGKVHTAALVHLAVQQGRLLPRDNIMRWWPDFPEARHITLEHLLTHTSGIRSFNSGEFTSQLPPHEYHAPETIIQAVQGSSNLFCPGAAWSYSNTGYVMLGRVLESVEQQAYGDLLRQRLFVPLGLAHSAVIEPRALPIGLVTLHPGGEPRDEPGIATPYAAGAIAARADDMVRFWHAWLAGRLLPVDAVRRSFARLYPMFGKQELYYGEGVMLMHWTDAAGRPRRWLGHLGGAPGANALIAYDPSSSAYVAVAVNSDVSSSATANALLQTLESWQAPAP